MWPINDVWYHEIIKSPQSLNKDTWLQEHHGYNIKVSIMGIW